jgi:hypothetical protein
MSNDQRVLRSFTAIMIVVVVIAAAVVGLMALLKWAAASSETPDAILLPLASIAGIIALVAVLSVAAVVFSLLKLADPQQALGLPAGSVRAVIALSLIVIFVIAGVFFYSDLAKIDTRKSVGLTQEQLNAIPGSAIVSLTPNPDGKKFDVELRVEKGQASQDLAKQILTALITLVSAVAAFYFGTRAVESALGPKGEQPTLRIDSPTSDPHPKVVPSAKTPLSITLSHTPIGEAVIWDPPRGDPAGELLLLSTGAFEYRPSPQAESIVRLKFRLANHPGVAAEMVVETT